jgi:oligopeptide/dipeptide ABC transporter ATP-binding protein
MPPLLEIQNLHTYFYTDGGVVKAVNDISYQVGEGESVGIVGESGSGKSVSALSILGLVPYPGRIVEGRILFEGADLLSLRQREMQRIRGRRIGMIFQEPMTSLNPVLTIERQLTESLETHMGMGRAAARRRAVELLDMVGIADPRERIKEHPHRLSGGMRQRVMIAMALSCNPNLIIADEPTTAVDVTIQAQLLELMKSLTRELNVALIIISHNMGIVARYVDRVFIMYAGKIVEHGPVAQTFRSPQHPYTLGLLRSIPRLDLERRDKLESIPGQPPDLAHLPKGCAFRERCSYAVQRCEDEIPPLAGVVQDQWSACWKAPISAPPEGLE